MAEVRQVNEGIRYEPGDDCPRSAAIPTAIQMASPNIVMVVVFTTVVIRSAGETGAYLPWGRVYGLDNLRIHVNYSGVSVWSNRGRTSDSDGVQYPLYCDLHARLTERRAGLAGEFDGCLHARSDCAHCVPSAVAPDIYANRQRHNRDAGRGDGSAISV